MLSQSEKVTISVASSTGRCRIHAPRLPGVD
jgi:hypothetical protein